MSCVSMTACQRQDKSLSAEPLFCQNRVFSNESVVCIRWPKYWSFSFSICSSNGYSGLISFRIDRLDLLAVQGTLKSLLQHHSSKALILRHAAFFMVPTLTSICDYQKNHNFDYTDLSWQVMSLLFNTLNLSPPAQLTHSLQLLRTKSWVILGSFSQHLTANFWFCS